MSEVQLKQWEMEYQAFLETQPDKEEYLRQLKTLRGLVDLDNSFEEFCQGSKTNTFYSCSPQNWGGFTHFISYS